MVDRLKAPAPNATWLGSAAADIYHCDAAAEGGERGVSWLPRELRRPVASCYECLARDRRGPSHTFRRWGSSEVR